MKTSLVSKTDPKFSESSLLAGYINLKLKIKNRILPLDGAIEPYGDKAELAT